MERTAHFLSKKLIWASVIVQIAMLSSASNLTTTELPQVPLEVSNEVEVEGEGFAWSAWGSWGPCSRTCGGGVSMQERQCLPRTRSNVSDNSIAQKPVISVRVTRQTREPDCPGVDRRYHECNNAPCPDGLINSRAEQCAAFDRRPFRGRFYTWVPYIDGNAPCTLNCRPLGQQFYASLSLVADGTPCTRQGFRAICVQGTCKAVGREGVLSASSARELRCGRRLVSGLFSRPRLPLGYSYVTTVPRGACRLNVSEITPTDNYIALKISNGSYIMNGEFAVSAAGTYEAAGARFLYSREGSLDSVLAPGPIQQPIDIMILYTQPNPSIKYEYFTESLPDEVETESVVKEDFIDVTPTLPTKHYRRHHSYDSFSRPSVVIRNPSGSKELSTDDEFDVVFAGNRKFLWKILSYSPCTRSCGGGIQLGKYRCVDSSTNDHEVPSTLCFGATPPPRRRRCGGTSCPPRWRAAAWTQCPKCGPATRTRIVGCVQDHSKGITKISDQKCPSPKPPTEEKCDIPDCSGSEVRPVASKRVLRPREHTDAFREGPVYSVAVNSTDLDVGPEYSFSATAGWLYTEWSECVGWCVGGGMQTRNVRCADPAGCTPRKAPESTRTCTPKQDCEPLEGQWFTGDWSPCSSPCGGKQVRGVLCIGGTGRHLKDSACHTVKPPHQRDCSTGCQPTWYYSDWGQCTGNCTSGSSTGVQRRSVVCARLDAGAASDTECGPAPRAARACDPPCGTNNTPPLSIESQKGYTTTTLKSTSTQRIYRNEFISLASAECKDRLYNCQLAVQARLCHYKYYTQNCCHSCAVRHEEKKKNVLPYCFTSECDKMKI